MITADRWSVGDWIDEWGMKEIDEMITDLINGEYKVEQLKEDFAEWQRLRIRSNE